MKSFKQLNIQAVPKPFSGRKIDIERLIDQKIVISAFKIGPSKFPNKGNGLRLDLQVTYDGAERVTWTAGIALQEMILQVPAEDFPFTTTIIRANSRFEFS